MIQLLDGMNALTLVFVALLILRLPTVSTVSSSHNCARLVVSGMVKNEGNMGVGEFPPFPISYRAIVPKREEVTNLLVPVCLPASDTAFGKIWMELVFMVLDQSAAVAACLAIDKNRSMQGLAVDDIKATLAANSKDGLSTAKFVAEDLDPGRYLLYTYSPKMPESLPQYRYPVSDGQQVQIKP